MAGVGKGTKLSDEWDPAPVVAGFWYGAACGYKDNKYNRISLVRFQASASTVSSGYGGIAQSAVKRFA